MQVNEGLERFSRFISVEIASRSPDKVPSGREGSVMGTELRLAYDDEANGEIGKLRVRAHHRHAAASKTNKETIAQASNGW